MKTYPLRLSQEEAAELQRAARVDGLTMADELRLAVRARLQQLRADPDFQERLRESMQQDREVYQRLGGLQDY
jgi:hypothetical protein